MATKTKEEKNDRILKEITQITAGISKNSNQEDKDAAEARVKQLYDEYESDDYNTIYLKITAFQQKSGIQLPNSPEEDVFGPQYVRSRTLDSNPSDPNDNTIWAYAFTKRIDTPSVEPGPGTYKRYGGKKRTRKYKNGKKTMKKNKGKRGSRY